MISIRHLRYFAALAEHRHFGQAAAACSISQPALSVQIRELEEILGAPLADRTGRRVGLTGLGEDIAERTRSILSAIDELPDAARAHGGGLSGPFRLGVIPTVAPYLLPTILARLAERHPGLELRPREAVTQYLLDAVLDGKLDAAIVALPVPEPALAVRVLFSEDFVLLRPRSEAERPVPPVDRLAEMRLMLLEEGHCFRDQALEICNLSSVVPGRFVEGSSLSTLVQMVGAGMGVTLIPEMALPLETRSAGVSVARLPAPAPRRTIGMIWREKSPIGRDLMRIADDLVDLQGAVTAGGKPRRIRKDRNNQS